MSEEIGNVYAGEASDYGDDGGLVPASGGGGVMATVPAVSSKHIILGHDITPLDEEDDEYLDALRIRGADEGYIDLVRKFCWMCHFSARSQMASNAAEHNMLKLVQSFNDMAVNEFAQFKVIHACKNIKDQFTARFHPKRTGGERMHFLLRNIAEHYLLHDQSHSAVQIQDKQAHIYLRNRVLDAITQGEIGLEKGGNLFVRLSANYFKVHGTHISSHSAES